MKTADIQALMLQAYSSNEWGIFFEVGNSTGHTCSGWADAIAMELWPSRGLTFHGFEIKVSRTDWQKELKNPAKAELMFHYCDYWWVVTAPNIIKPGELPPTWGHIEATEDGKLITKAKAEFVKPEKQHDRKFIAALFRAAYRDRERYLQTVLQPAIEAEKEAINQRAEYMVERKYRDAIDRAERTTDLVEKINNIIGDKDCTTRYFNDEEFCNAVRFALASKQFGAYRNIKTLIDAVGETHQELKQAAIKTGIFNV